MADHRMVDPPRSIHSERLQGIGVLDVSTMTLGCSAALAYRTSSTLRNGPRWTYPEFPLARIRIATRTAQFDSSALPPTMALLWRRRRQRGASAARPTPSTAESSW